GRIMTFTGTNVPACVEVVRKDALPPRQLVSDGHSKLAPVAPLDYTQLNSHLGGCLMKTFLFFLLLAATVCLPQSTSSISGTVTDPSGAVIPGAAVTVTNEETGVSNRQTATDSGLFSFPALPVGNYSVTVEMKGFRTQRKSRNVLVVNTPLTVDM